MRDRLRRYLLEPLGGFLTRGVSPRRLALCVAIGIVVGNMPILGLSTVLCTIIALRFGLNLPAIQLVQGAMAPTQVLLIIPYVRLGELLLRAPAEPLSIKAGLELLNHDTGHAIVLLWNAIVHAGFAFLVVAPIAIFVIYRMLAPVFEGVAVPIAPKSSLM